MPEHLVTCHSAATVANQSETVETYLGTPDAAATAEVSCWRGRDVALKSLVSMERTTVALLVLQTLQPPNR